MKALLVLVVSLASAFEPEWIPGSWMVQLKKGSTAASTSAILAEYGLTAKHTYTNVFHGFSFDRSASDPILAKLRFDERVELLEQDQVARVFLPEPVKVNKTLPLRGKACATQTADVSWGLSRVCIPGRIGPDGISDRFNYDTTAGQGVEYYTVDTGILLTHDEFGGRAEFLFKAEPGWSNTDGNGHGTHVTSTVAGRTYGVAKLTSNLYSIKVLSDQGSGSFAGVVAGVDFVTGRTTRDKKVVVNLSLGGGASQITDNAVNACQNAGAFVAVAAGNNNADACNYSPSRATAVWSTGATTIGANGDLRASFSNYGRCTKGFAPGQDIKGAWIGSNSATRIISGTSMASPHMAGAAALYFGSGASTNDDVIRLIRDFGTQGVIDLNCANQACRDSPNLMVFTGCDCRV